ncbi:hypothetical protein LNO88_19945 [Klebsiella pneumoniae subsp. pneumoniae]|nr:hypothetical protein [Klebsiella pneumoniae subsp. pneumoniae]
MIIPLYEMLGANPSIPPARCWRATWAVSSSLKNSRAATWRPGCTQA